MAKENSEKDRDHVLSSSERDSLVSSLNKHLGGQELQSKTSEQEAGVGETTATQDDAKRTVRQLGRFLFFAKGPTPEPGSAVVLGEQRYQIQPAAWYWRFAPLLVLLAIPILITLLLLKSPAPDHFPLLGVVTDSESGGEIAGAAVSIPDLSMGARADAAGRFRLEQLPSKSYLVKVNAPGYEPTFASVVVGDRAEILHLEMTPLISDTTETEVEEAEPEPESEPVYGTIRVKSNREDVTVALNGKPLGEGNKRYSRIKPGRHVIQLSSPTFEAHVEEIDVKAGHTTEVVAILVPEPEPEQPMLGLEDYLERGDSLLALGEYLEAIGYYTLAIADSPESPQPYHKRARANLKLSNQLAAIADFREAGTLFSQNGNYGRAIECFDQILELSPGAVPIYQLRGWAKIWSGGTQGGLVDLEKALSFDDDNWRARFQLGKALCLTGDYDAAEKHLKKIRKHDDKQPQVNAFLALAYLGKEKQDDAVKYYRKYAELATSESNGQLERLASWNQLLTLAAEADD